MGWFSTVYLDTSVQKEQTILDVFEVGGVFDDDVIPSLLPSEMILKIE